MSFYETFRLVIWVFGIPLIVALTVRAVRKMRQIRVRHLELLEEEKANPQDAYARLAEIFQDRQKH